MSFARTVSLLLIWTFPLFAVAQVTLVPASPRPDETVRVQTPLNNVLLDANVSMVGNKITLELVFPGGDFATPPLRGPIDVPIGRYPAGSYQVEVFRRFEGSADLLLLGTAAFTVPRRANTAPMYDHTDLWWNPNESGWGLNIVQHASGIIFATWFSYDSDGTPAWYSVSSGQWSRKPPQPNLPANVYVGEIYRTTGPVVADSFDPSKVTRTLVGQLRLTFSDRRWGDGLRAEIMMDGRTISKDLQRFEF